MILFSNLFSKNVVLITPQWVKYFELINPLFLFPAIVVALEVSSWICWIYESVTWWLWKHETDCRDWELISTFEIYCYHININKMIIRGIFLLSCQKTIMSNHVLQCKPDLLCNYWSRKVSYPLKIISAKYCLILRTI